MYFTSFPAAMQHVPENHFLALEVVLGGDSGAPCGWLVSKHFLLHSIVLCWSGIENRRKKHSL